MSQLSLVIPEDEFGGLEWIGLPGQDPDMIHTMLETLTKEVEPKNVIERCWIRDIAILTVRMNFMRRAGTVQATAPIGEGWSPLLASRDAKTAQTCEPIPLLQLLAGDHSPRRDDVRSLPVVLAQR